MLGAASRCWDQLQLHLELALSRSGASIPEASLKDTDGIRVESRAPSVCGRV